MAPDGVGSSKWVISLLSWGQAYMGMIRSVASWGIEVGRGDRRSGEWRWKSTNTQRFGSALGQW